MAETRPEKRNPNLRPSTSDGGEAMIGEVADQKRSLPKRKQTRRSTMRPQVPQNKTLWQRLEAKLPPWALKIKDTRQQKLFIRCWLGSWIMIVLLLPNANLRAMGNAAFFGAIASILIPSNMPIPSFLLAMLILVLGACFGWAWGCAAIRAAYTARDKEVYQQTLMKLAQQYGSNFNAAVVQDRIFHGDFLDTKSTVVFGVFLGVGAFAMGLLRTASPMLTLPAIFTTIFLDVICSYGPLIPTPDYTLLKSFLVSTAYYIGVGLVLILVVFPQTLNHEWLSGVSKLLLSVQQLLELHEQIFEMEIEEFTQDDDSLWAKLRTGADALLAAFQGLSGKTRVLKLEFSYGQLGADDLEGFELPIRNVITRSRGLGSFVTLMSIHREFRAQDEAEDKARVEQADAAAQTNLRELRVGDTFRLLHQRSHNAAWEAEHELQIEDLMPVLETATRRVRKALLNGVKVANNAFLIINTQRYKRKFPWWAELGAKAIQQEEADVAAALEELSAALEEFKSTNRFELLDLYEEILQSPFGVDQHGRPPFSLRPLFLCFVYQSNLLWTADAVKSLLVLLTEVQAKRPTSRLWWPKGLNELTYYFRSDRPDPLGQGLPPATPLASEEEQDAVFGETRRDPDSLPPTSLLQKIGQALHVFHAWLGTPRAIFAIKYTIITIALWLPSVLKKSAWFSYSERGLWGLIMGQMTLAVYMSDQLSALIGRIVGTLAGGVIGMLAWYIGSGHGHGNPYGLAASAAVFLLPIIFMRLYYPVPMEAIMTATTAILVIGYSWLNTHLTQLGNLGYGWDVAWRRVVLVFIGSAASLILMLLPPQSLRQDIRRSNARNIKDIARLYSLLLSTWFAEIEDPNKAQDDDDTSDADTDHKESLVSYEKWAPAFRTKIIEVATKLEGLRTQTNTAKWEGSFRGKWPFKKYERMISIQSTMLNNLVQLAGALTQLSPEWRRTLLHHTPFLNPNLITDVMSVFAIVAMSLSTGEAIHEVLPRSLLDRVYYHYSLGPWLNKVVDPNSPSSAPTIHEIDGKSGPGLGLHETALKKDIFHSPEFAYYATGVAGAYQILTALDELHRLTKELCGEVPLRGFEHWRKEFEMRQLAERA